MQDLQGKVAVVTGGANGIGRAISERLAGEGMRVALADVEDGALAAAVDELTAAGADVIGVRTDVTSLDEVEALRDATLSAFGAVHVVCNNAGIGTPSRIIDTPLERWRWMIDVNVWGLIHGCRTFVPLLVAQDEGHVVNTASLSGILATPVFGAYAATKMAIVGYSEALVQELAMEGSHVGVSVVCPSLTVSTGPTSDRNKPDYVPPATPDAEAVQRGLAAMMETVAMPASQVADAALDGIREQRFFVFPDREGADGSITTITEWMRHGVAPPAFPDIT